MNVIDPSKGRWFIVHADGFKLQVCPSSMVSQLVAEMELRSNGLVGDVEPVSRTMVDLPGMVMADRTYQDLELDGLKFSIPTQDFELMFKSLQKKMLRTFADGSKYYKLHGWLHCALFTPEQRERVLDWMEKRLPEVSKIAEEEDKEFLRRIDEINGDKERVVSARAELLRKGGKKHGDA